MGVYFGVRVMVREGSRTVVGVYFGARVMVHEGSGQGSRGGQYGVGSGPVDDYVEDNGRLNGHTCEEHLPQFVGPRNTDRDGEPPQWGVKGPLIPTRRRRGPEQPVNVQRSL